MFYLDRFNLIVFYLSSWEEGLDLANQKSQKVGVFGRKLEASHSIASYYFDNTRGNETIMFT